MTCILTLHSLNCLQHWGPGDTPVWAEVVHKDDLFLPGSIPMGKRLNTGAKRSHSLTQRCTSLSSGPTKELIRCFSKGMYRWQVDM